MSTFLTGATGFIGRRLLSRLDPERRGPVLCLVRDPEKLPAATDALRPVRGDLLDPDSYRGALAGVRTVVHVAALTGKGSDAEHFRVNADGTRRLLDAARTEGVSRFLHVSTIAVKFPEKRHYPYARSKEAAEGHVREGGPDWAIVRPTIVLGPGSPLWAKFEALASAPVLPVFGDGRNRVNPVHVDDVVTCLVGLLDSERLGGRTIEVGGRDVLTMEDFLRRMRRELRGTEGPVVHLPVRWIVRVLGTLEKVLLPLLPVSAGQFHAFLHEGVAEEGGGALPPVSERRGVDEMIRETTHAG
jgi:NADH dehydrogenase